MVKLGAVAAPPDIGSHLGATAFSTIPSMLIVGATIAYLWGAWRVARLHPSNGWPRRRSFAFVTSMACVFIAIESSVGVYDDTLFYDHMIQHLVLIMVAAPLIAMGAPVELLGRATRGRSHDLVARALRSPVAAVVGHPVTGFALYAVLVPAVHLTGLYNVSLTNDFFHDNEHLAFLVIGYLFWRPVVAIEPTRYPMSPPLRLVYLMLALPIDTFSGLVLMSANHEMFPYYRNMTRPWGPSLIGDLHMGGAIMWAAGDALMVVAMVLVVIFSVQDNAPIHRLDAERSRLNGVASLGAEG